MPKTKIDIAAKLMVVSDNIRKKIQAAVKGISPSANVKAATGSSGKDKSKEDEKQSFGISKMTGILAVIAAALKALQPIVDFIRLIAALTVIMVLKLLRAVGIDISKIPEYVQKLFSPLDEQKTALNGIKQGILDNIGFGSHNLGDESKPVDENAGILDGIKEGFASEFEWLIDLKNAVVTAITNLAGWIWDKLQQGYTWVVEKLQEIWNSIKEFAKTTYQYLKELPGKIWDKLKTGFYWIRDKIQTAIDWIKSLPGKIASSIKNVIPSFSSAKNSVVSAAKRFIGVDDAIITKDGQVIKTNPNDTIIATQNPGGQGGSTKIINIYGVHPKEIIDTIRREFATDINTSGRF